MFNIAVEVWLTVRFNGIIEPPKNVSALRLNQPDRIFEIAVPHDGKLNCDAGLAAAACHKDTIERGTKKPKAHCHANR